MNIEDLIIYKSHVNLIYYSELILEKYPRYEKELLVKNIRDLNFDIMKLIIRTYKEPTKSKKSYYLNEIDTSLKLLKVYVRISFRKKYINAKNYGAWSRKIANVNNLLFGWIKSVNNN